MESPLGDQTGALSAAPEVRVRLRASPSSTGTVKISPRASITTRLAVGDRDAEDTRRLTSSHRVSAQGKSPRISMSSLVVRPVAGSSVWIHPSCSRTRALGPPASHFTSASVKRVTWAVSPEATS